MTATIPAPTRINNKVNGSFYPLQKDELIALRKSRLINNSAFVHFALRMSNPFLDRPIELLPKEFSDEWDLPLSSVYEAIAKLESKKIIEIKTGKVVLSWINNDSTQNQDNCCNIDHCNLDETKTHSLSHSEISDSIAKSQNQFQDSGKYSESSENPVPEPLSGNSFDSSQTIHTYYTNQTQAEETEEKTELSVRNIGGVNYLVEEVHQPPQLTSVGETLNKPRNKPKPKRVEKIPQDLIDKLEELEISIDERVIKAISRHHISQAYSAAAHIERTKETISNPTGVFLYQLPKQKVEKELGVRSGLKTAADFPGYTLEHLKKMYPNNWREAAGYYGVDLQEE